MAAPVAPVLLNAVRTPLPRSHAMLALSYRAFEICLVTLIFTVFVG